MRTASDARTSREDRGAPMASFTVSLAGAVVALAASAAVVASADSFGRALELLFVFVVLTSLECVAYVEAIRPWLEGRPVPPRGQLLQLVVLVLVASTLTGGLQLAGVGVCALAAGVFLPNASAIRYRRVNRDLVEEGEPWVAEEGSSASATQVLDQDPDHPAVPTGTHEEPPGPTPPDRPARARPAPKVGTVLRAALNEERDRWLAWAAATLAVTVGCLAFGADRSVVLWVDILGVAAVAWVTSRLLGARIALRDFEEAQSEPRRAFVVVLRNPSPRGTGPLLGVWDKEPVLAGGRLPRADAVYRCDAGRDALFSTRGEVVVHRAWVDTGPRAGSRPRWVAADAGVALPRHRAVLGPQQLDSTIGKERPPRSRSLSMPAPNPTTETETGIFVTVINEPVPETRQLVTLFAWRLAVLALVAALLAWGR